MKKEIGLPPKESSREGEGGGAFITSKEGSEGWRLKKEKSAIYSRLILLNLRGDVRAERTGRGEKTERRDDSRISGRKRGAKGEVRSEELLSHSSDLVGVDEEEATRRKPQRKFRIGIAYKRRKG